MNKNYYIVAQVFEGSEKETVRFPLTVWIPKDADAKVTMDKINEAAKKQNPQLVRWIGIHEIYQI